MIQLYQQEVTQSSITVAVDLEFKGEVFSFTVTISEDENIGYEQIDIVYIDDNILPEEVADNYAEFIRENVKY